MLKNLRKPKAQRSGGPGSGHFTIHTTAAMAPVEDSPVTDGSYCGGNPFAMRTPDGGGSAFGPASPPPIRRLRARADDPFALPALDGAWATGGPDGGDGGTKEKPVGSPCDRTARTATDTAATAASPESSGDGPPPPPPPPTAAAARPFRRGSKGKGKGKGKGSWGRSEAFQKQLLQIKASLPKTPKALQKAKAHRGGGAKKKRTDIDLADLAVAPICIVPRHGAGIAVGRLPFERMRTSLVLHMVQENRHAGWQGGGRGGGGGEGAAADGGTSSPAARLNARLRDCIADGETCFAEKSQEAVRLAKDALEVSALAPLRCHDALSRRRSRIRRHVALRSPPRRGTQATAGDAAAALGGRRNALCAQFLAGLYRDVVADETAAPSRDGPSLLVVAGAHYALGKFQLALAAYHRAGLALQTKVSTTAAAPPARRVHCSATLFNNLGCVYFELGRYEKAMRTFQRALALFHGDAEDAVAVDASVLAQASTLNNMAYTLLKFKQYEDASDLVNASFELQQIVLGDDNATMIISTLSTMAFIYYRTKNYKTSLDTYSGENKCHGSSLFRVVPTQRRFPAVSRRSLHPAARQKPHVQRERPGGSADQDGGHLQKAQGSREARVPPAVHPRIPAVVREMCQCYPCMLFNSPVGY